jgi:membrane peptidoglycan carboxypeptidase
MQMQPREMWELFTQVGHRPEAADHLSRRRQRRCGPYKTWRPIEQATMCYGYGLSAACSRWRRPTRCSPTTAIIPATLLKSSEPAVGVECSQPKPARKFRTMLQMAAGPGGTGPKAQTVGYSVGGKSGTAYKQVGKGYVTNKYRSWFVGIAPVDKPRIIVAVMVDEPSAGKYFGGDVAAPVFSATVQQTLRMMGVQPDMSVKPQVVVGRRGGVVLMFELHSPQDAAQWLHGRVTGTLQSDSRKIAEGDGFIAWPGAATDGRKHVPPHLPRARPRVWSSARASKDSDSMRPTSPPMRSSSGNGPDRVRVFRATE